jgi:hypothetical protein
MQRFNEGPAGAEAAGTLIRSRHSSVSESRQAVPGSGLNHATSDAIRIARVLCILSMISVHIWPGATKIEAADTWFHWVYIFVAEYLGRGSVPLLSLISGVLLTTTIARRPPLKLLLNKAFSLLYPMAVWSALLLGVYEGHAIATGDETRVPHSPAEWINGLLSVTSAPVNEPLAFLRDVFMCAIIGVASILLYRRNRVAGGALLLIMVLVEALSGGVLTLRPQILAFFAVGVVIGLSGKTHLVPPISLVVNLLILDVAAHGWMEGELVDWLNRICISVLMWRIAVDIEGWGGALSAGLRRVEPYIFMVFCSHMLTVTVVAAAAGVIGFSPDAPYFPLIWIGQFPLVIIVAVVIQELAQKAQVLPLLTGSRTRT